MRLSRVAWVPGTGPRSYDVHLLRGAPASGDLRPFINLTFERTSADPAATLPRVIRASEIDLPANAALKALLQNGKIRFESPFTLRPEHAITIDPDTGAVTARVPTPAEIVAAGGKIENFLIRVVATRAPDGSTATTGLRLHLHGQVDQNRVTLSPTSLTARTGGGPIRFGVLAQFDDQVVGDLSRDQRLTWTLLIRDAAGNLVPAPFNNTTRLYSITEGTTVALTLLSDRTSANNGELRATGTGFSADVFVRCGIELSPGVVVETPPAQVLSGPRWVDSAGQPFRVRFIDGDGLNRLDQVPNVLIVGDGFRDEDEPIFDELVRRLIAEVRHNGSTEPYATFLKNRSINFFSTFIRSREFGCSILYELQPEVGGILANPLPSPSIPPVTGATHVEHLIYVVGLPIPADAPLTLDAAITRWTKLFGNAFTTTVPLGILQSKLFAEWKKLAGRTLAIERDTALGIAVGERPTALGSFGGNVSFNDFRANGQNDLRLILESEAVVRESSGRRIPALWKLPAATDTVPAGKDYRYVVILCAGLPAAGATSLGVRIAKLGIGPALRPVALNPFVPPPSHPQGDWRIVQPDPGQPSPDAFLSTQGTFLHELGHCLALGDEYGGRIGTPGQNEMYLTKEFGNITLETTIRGPDPGPTDPFDITRAFWGSALRVRAAGVLLRSPEAVTVAGQRQYRITLLRDHATGLKNLALKKNDAIFLRVRPLLEATMALMHPGLGREPDVNNVPPVPPDFTVGLSPRLNFESYGTDDSLMVSVPGGGTLATTWNVPGQIRDVNPIVFAPTVAANGTPLPLISPLVAAHLASVRGPNSRPAGIACTPVEDPEFRIPAQKEVRSMPEAVRNAVQTPFLSKVVGAYDTGATLDCGVFHPTGYCAMEQSSESVVIKLQPYPRTFRSGGTSEYCHVCRYLLIDRVDPTLHGMFDDLYRRLYVEGP